MVFGNFRTIAGCFLPFLSYESSHTASGLVPANSWRWLVTNTILCCAPLLFGSFTILDAPYGLMFELLIICYSVGGKTSARAEDCCTESTKHCWVCHFLPLPLLFLWKGRFCLWLYRCNMKFPLLLLLCSPAKQILMWFSKWVCISREKRRTA